MIGTLSSTSRVGHRQVTNDCNETLVLHYACLEWKLKVIDFTTRLYSFH